VTADIPVEARGGGQGAAFASTWPHGHRGRMREKRLSRAPEALAEYELQTLRGVGLHDHVIVGNGRCFSFRGEGLLEQS
jgi:DNA repair protein RadC